MTIGSNNWGSYKLVPNDGPEMISFQCVLMVGLNTPACTISWSTRSSLCQTQSRLHHSSNIGRMVHLLSQLIGSINCNSLQTCIAQPGSHHLFEWLAAAIITRMLQIQALSFHRIATIPTVSVDSAEHGGPELESGHFVITRAPYSSCAPIVQ